MQDPYVMCVELSLDGGRRHQAIFLSELHDDDGRNYLRVNTVIAPITGFDARRALAFNWQSRIGYLAIDELDGVPYQIGRASCRERVCQYVEISVVRVTFTTKNN